MHKHLLTSLCILLMLLVGSSTWADNVLSVSDTQGDFCLMDGRKNPVIVIAPSEHITIHKTATLFADDVERVTGVKPTIMVKASKQKGAVVIATIGHNTYVDRLIERGKIDVSAIRDGWEQYTIQVLDGQLFIIGSDRRGAAYGVFALSEQMGVSPWYWWADVPVEHHPTLYVTARYTSESPTVRYRGIFINDEDWGLKPWAANNYERNLGDIGPRTYARVCELLLRLRANMLAPAMHSCTGAFYSHPESKVVADSFGIIITTSHCEPLLLNNAAKSEWDQQRDGDWNYKTNSETILRKWDDRLTEAARYENIYTVAMRGLHDAGLRGNLPMQERVPLIEEVIRAQRELLAIHLLPREADEIPQIFVPYKETMDIYENGLRVPDDITLVWVDDNYGYMKRVSNPQEQQRSGRAGVYYHLSYLGAPHDYLWLNTTPPVLMYEELKKAYDHGADRYWLLNVGDIKPMELGMQTFMDMAWNINDFSFEKANSHQAEFIAQTFNIPGLKPQISDLLDNYYRLAWSRKPEFMGWEYQWDDAAHTGLKPTEFSYRHYDEAQRRLADYQRLSDLAERLAVSGLPTDATQRAAFFELIQFPIQAAYQMNRKFLMAQLNQELAAEGRYAEANWAARQMEQAFDSINALNSRYNEQLNGKWRGIMALSTSFTSSCQYYQKPEVVRTDGAGERSVILTPSAGKVAAGDSCYVVDLARYDSISDDAQLINGLGYDWQVMQLGTASYMLPRIDSDSISVTVYTVPFWPVYTGRSNAVNISIDSGQPQVFENTFREYDRTWKDQVMRNGAHCRLRFAIDPTRQQHTINFSSVEHGQMLQRVIIDWGGLQPSYIGPNI